MRKCHKNGQMIQYRVLSAIPVLQNVKGMGLIPWAERTE
jgi:hypothetical protein